MKTMTCAQMGGMCDAKITAATKDEMLANGMKHLEESHPEMASTVKTMAPDNPMMIEWAKKFDAEWDATPES